MMGLLIMLSKGKIEYALFLFNKLIFEGIINQIRVFVSFWLYFYSYRGISVFRTNYS
jgi:hypothetical protein